MKKRIILLGLLNVLAVSTLGQSFQNLNFEGATNLPSPGGFVPVTNALPGWTVFYGASQQNQIYYDGLGGETPIELVDTNFGDSYGAIDGKYSVQFSTGPGTSIAQTGLVPPSAESLLFDVGGLNIASGDNPASSLLVSLGGQNLSYTVVSNEINSYGQDYNVYAASIPSDLAGQTETLTFLDSTTTSWIVDDIQFSPTIVPEPGEFALLGLGAILFAVCHRRKSISWNR